MKAYYYLIFTLLLPSFQALSQTKLIFHKSHGGSLATFNTVIHHNLFDIDLHDFGEAPRPRVKNAQLDSVIYVSDTMAIMVTSEYCKYSPKDPDEEKIMWTAGKDTLYNHPLFSQQHSLDSIRKVIRKTYSFKNNVKDIEFVGYDNKTPFKQHRKKRKREQQHQIAPVYLQQPPHSNTLIYLLAGIVLILSLLTGIAAYKIQQLRSR